MEREILDALAKAAGKSPGRLLLEWYSDPSKAPDWFLAGMSSERYRRIATDTSNAMSPAARTKRASLAGTASHASRQWKNSKAKMRSAFASLKRMAGADAFDRVAEALDIDPGSFREADADAYSAFILMRDNLGLKPKRVRKKAS